VTIYSGFAPTPGSTLAAAPLDDEQDDDAEQDDDEQEEEQPDDDADAETLAAPLVLLAQLLLPPRSSSLRPSEMMRSRARISRRGRGGEHGEEPAQALVRDVAGARHRELDPVAPHLQVVTDPRG